MKLSFKILALASAASLANPVGAGEFENAFSALREGKPTEGASIFHKLALAGDRDAMFNLAVLYHRGFGLPQSPEDALYWAWRARLDAQEKGQALVDRLFQVSTKEQRLNVYRRLNEETQENVNAEAPLSFVKLALIEQSLAAKPNQIEIYASSAMAVALGYSRATNLRNEAAARLSPKDTKKAEQRLRELYGDWCVEQPTPPAVCASLAVNN